MTASETDTDPTSDLFPVDVDQTVPLTVVNYVSEFGDALVTKKVCDDLIAPAIAVTERGVALGEPADSEPCVYADAAFEIYPHGDRQVEPIRTETDLDGLSYLNDLRITIDGSGPHLIVEVATGAERTFDVRPSGLTVIEVVNPLQPPVGTLVVVAETCDDTTELRIEVSDPVAAGSVALPEPAEDCAFATAELEVYRYGDRAPSRSWSRATRRRRWCCPTWK